MRVTLSGIVIDLNEEQPLKASHVIYVKLFGIMMEVSDEQSSKHIPLTPSGIVIDLRSEE
jgi:hypothetical protein